MTDPWIIEHLAEVESHGNKGMRCPACTQRVSVDRRRLTRMMALFLVRLVRLHEQEPGMYSTRQILNVSAEKVSSDGAYLVMWDLIKKGNPARVSKHGTYYTPTVLGIRFAHGEAKVPSYKDRLVGHVIKTSPDLVDIFQALKVPHGYEDILGAPPLHT